MENIRNFDRITQVIKRITAADHASQADFDEILAVRALYDRGTGGYTYANNVYKAAQAFNAGQRKKFRKHFDKAKKAYDAEVMAEWL
ncbi:hypothetical protein [Alkalicoccus chagannorensis]|uniref:hypothetical protein n=1 Tax=Alkalicoccus chagannorensis TaxID=427072 RepID=UPI000404B48C|nr:hypothetical protein [Alkalicoccus chagannorensis]